MRNWSIPIGKLFGVEIRLHLTFVFLLGFVWMAESAMPKSNNTPDRALALVGIVFASVVLHELGHALVAKGQGTQAKAIILLPIGGITLLDESQATPSGPVPLKWKRDVLVALGGGGWGGGWGWGGGGGGVVCGFWCCGCGCCGFCCFVSFLLFVDFVW